MFDGHSLGWMNSSGLNLTFPPLPWKTDGSHLVHKARHRTGMPGLKKKVQPSKWVMSVSSLHFTSSGWYRHAQRKLWDSGHSNWRDAGRTDGGCKVQSSTTGIQCWTLFAILSSYCVTSPQPATTHSSSQHSSCQEVLSQIEGFDCHRLFSWHQLHPSPLIWSVLLLLRPPVHGCWTECLTMQKFSFKEHHLKRWLLLVTAHSFVRLMV